MSNVLVTGGNGFIGSHLVDGLIARGDHRVTILSEGTNPFYPIPDQVTYVEGTTKNADLIRQTLSEHAIDFVYHVAWASIGETALKSKAADIENNLIPTVNLLDACKEAGVKRFLFFSSGGAVYGLPESGEPVRENHPTSPISPYGITKLATEKYLEMYRRLYGMQYAIFRPSVPFGPRQNPLRRQGAVSVFTHRALRGEAIEIWGDGGSLRDYFYIGDMAEPLIRAMELPEAESITCNLGGTQGYSLLELVSTVEDTLNLKIEVNLHEARGFDVPRLLLDSSVAAKRLGWSPKTTLADGIRSTADWLKENVL